MEKVLTYRKLVKTEDLNPAGRLFGGRMMEWMDEAAAMYAICQLQTQRIVTIKVSEILFKEPIYNGDIIECFASTKHCGRTSFTVSLEVKRKAVAKDEKPKVAVTCDLVFVTVDKNGRPVPNRFAKKKKRA